MGHSSATTRKSERNLDFYPTPDAATRILLAKVNVDGIVLEPCAGDGRMADVIRLNFKQRYAAAGDFGVNRGVITNDIDATRSHDFQLDATKRETWEVWKPVDFVVTNPPYNNADEILKLAHEYVRVGVAMLLRLSILEPCDDRGPWLEKFPPHHQIVLPRISFKKTVREVEGKQRISHTDNLTCAWYVWYKFPLVPKIEIVSKEQFERYR